MANLFQEGQQFFNNDKLEEALERFNLHLKDNSKDVKALYYRAMTYRKLNKHQDALIDLGVAVTLVPSDADLICERGISHYHLNNFKEALDDLNLAQSLDPDNPFRYSSRAFILSNLNKIDEAIQDYKKAIALDPSDAVAYNNLGLLEEKRGRMDEAKKQFAEADKITKGETADEEKPDVDQLIKEFKEEEAKKKAAKKKTKEKKQAIAPSTKANITNEKMSVGFFFKTIKELVTNKEERKAFADFIRGMLGKK